VAHECGRVGCSLRARASRRLVVKTKRAAAVAAMNARVGATCSVVEAEELVRRPVSLIW
jgi:hypothetical protein